VIEPDWMPNHKVLAVWFLWLLAVVQPGAAWPGKQHKQKQRHGAQGQQQQQQEPLNAFMGVLAAQTAPAVAAYQSVLAYNHSLALPLRANGECPRGFARRSHTPHSTADGDPVSLQQTSISSRLLLLLLLPVSQAWCIEAPAPACAECSAS
jgi:hypothetical protein